MFEFFFYNLIYNICSIYNNAFESLTPRFYTWITNNYQNNKYANYKKYLKNYD